MDVSARRKNKWNKGAIDIIVNFKEHYIKQLLIFGLYPM